ncbi:MAG: Tox-REase-5 domain-containing protein [Agriterribacter sp.]
MQPKISFTALLLFCVIVVTNAQNPYKEIGKQGKTLTLTKGQFNEAFDEEDVQQIGTVLVNIRTMKVVKMMTEDEAEKRLDNTVGKRFLSVDPIARNFPWISPYSYAENDVIRSIDLDGAEKKVVVHWVSGFHADGKPKVIKTAVDIDRNVKFIEILAQSRKPTGKEYAHTELYYALPNGDFIQGQTLREEISPSKPKPSANYDYTQTSIPRKGEEDNGYMLRDLDGGSPGLFSAIELAFRDSKAPDNYPTMESLGGVDAALIVMGAPFQIKGMQAMWVRESTSGWSSFSKAYQKQIAGQEGQALLLNGTKFDGLVNGTLLDAKGKYAFLLEKGWAQEGLLKQAARQIKAANGTKIEWHFAEEEAANMVKRLFNEKGVKGIDVHYTPSISNP